MGFTLNSGLDTFFTTMPGILADFRGIRTSAPGFKFSSEE